VRFAFHWYSKMPLTAIVERLAGAVVVSEQTPDVTAPFWKWLFDQTPADIRGQRFAAQQEDARWLRQA